MGYYTSHDLNVVGENAAQFSDDLDNGLVECEYGDAREVFPDGLGCWSESVKWYGYLEDVQKWSLKYPNTTFILECNGEDSEYWRVYARNNEIETVDPIITWPEPTIDINSLMVDDTNEDLPDEFDEDTFA